MFIKIMTFFVLGLSILSGCNQNGAETANRVEDNNTSSSGTAGGGLGNVEARENAENKAAKDTESSSAGQTSQPQTVRDFFMLLPEKYFTLEGCDRANDKDCRQARVNYLKDLGEIVDIKNGYIKGGCDGGQSCIEMTIFKRPDQTYVVAVSTSAEMMEASFFLDYKNGVWSDISTEIVPDYSRKNLYELPRFGTTIKVYAKKIIEQGDDYEVSEKGRKLYDLEWKDGKFVKK